MGNPITWRSIAAGAAAAAVLALAACSDSSTGSSGEPPPDTRVPATLTVVSGDAQSDTSGALLPQPVVVEVRDAAGQPIGGATVTFQVTSGGGSVAPASAVTGTDGRAETRWTLGKVAADSQRLAASTVGAGGAAIVARATATRVAGNVYILFSGSDQLGNPGQTLRDSLVVIVERNSERAAGVPVVWSTDPGNGTVSPGQSVTNAGGFVRAAWTLGDANGDQHAYATVGGQRVTFTAGPIKVSMLGPAPGGTADDTAQFYVVIHSTFQIQSVTAEVEGRSVSLAFLNGAAWTGKLPLVGLAQGSKITTLTATDVAGHSVVNRYPFYYDHPPVLTVTSPQVNDVALGSVRVQASCTDDFGGCTVVVFTVNSEYGYGVPERFASARGSLDVAVPMTVSPGQRAYIRVEAVDSLDAAAEPRVIPLHWQNAASLSVAATGGIRMLDIDATRLLYVDSSAAGVTLKVRNRGTGAEQTVPLPAGAKPEDAGLTAYGAAFTVRTSGVTELYDWRGGGSDRVVENAGGCQYLPHYLGCTNGAYYDLAAHALRNLVGTSPDLADNGDAVSVDGSGRVQLFRGGVTTVLVNNARNPRTDGVNVLFQRITFHPPDDSVFRYDPAGNEFLSNTNRGDYDAVNGWIAYPVSISPGFYNGQPHQLFTRSPAGVTRQATLFSSGAFLRSLGPSGQVVFTPPIVFQELTPLYVAAVPYTSPVVAGHLVSTTGVERQRIRWVGDELYLLLGRAALKVAY